MKLNLRLVRFVCKRHVLCARQVVAVGLHPKGQYKELAVVRLVGMLLLVYVKAEHTPFVHNVAVETVATGFMGKVVSFSQLNTFISQTRYIKTNFLKQNFNKNIFFIPEV